ncbi:hypothetical protein CDD83_8378 [Cordyceps sp. RAO-2017]|nr:hypothetical protein CDD83_8378 [Cordyceps sp. RAO-2017]
MPDEAEPAEPRHVSGAPAHAWRNSKSGAVALPRGLEFWQEALWSYYYYWKWLRASLICLATASRRQPSLPLSQLRTNPSHTPDRRPSIERQAHLARAAASSADRGAPSRLKAYCSPFSPAMAAPPSIGACTPVTAFP